MRLCRVSFQLLFLQWHDRNSIALPTIPSPVVPPIVRFSVVCGCSDSLSMQQGLLPIAGTPIGRPPSVLCLDVLHDRDGVNRYHIGGCRSVLELFRTGAVPVPS